MGIEVASSFTRKAAVPVDDSSVVADVTARNAIAAGIRYKGFRTYVIADKKTYILKNDITNTDWEEDGGAIPTVNRSVNVFSGTGSQTAFVLSADPGSVNNTDVYIFRVHQDHSSYTISTVSSVTTLTFSAPPPVGTDNIIVTFGSSLTVSTPADASVTKLKLAALGQQISPSCGGTYAPTGSYTDVYNLSVTLVTTGRPVWVGLVSDGSGGAAIVGCTNSTATTFVSIDVKMFDGATEIHRSSVTLLAPAAGQSIQVPASAINQIYVPSAGSHTIKVQAKVSSGAATPTGYVTWAKLVAYEI